MNYHVLNGNEKGDSFKVAFHIAVPVEQNKANTAALRASLAEDPWIDKTSIVPWIDAAEQTKLTNGELYEHVETFATHPDRTTGNDRTRLDARYTQLSSSIVTGIRRRYAYWRYNRDVS